MSAGTKAIALDAPIVRISEVIAADMDGEIGMMSLDKGMYYAFNDVGTRIWQLIEKPRTISGIITELCKEYDVDVATCREHVLEFLQMLHKNELIHISDNK
jgi:hypothetical protein